MPALRSRTDPSRVWKEMLSGIRNPLMTMETEMKVEGGILNLIRFLRMFQGRAGAFMRVCREMMKTFRITFQR